MYRKLMPVIISFTLILSLTACSGANGNNNRTSDAAISLTGEIGGEITISVYDAMTYKAFLEDAARLFEVKYPGMSVKIEAFTAMPEIKTDGQGMIMADEQDDSQDRADYISRVNTSLMSDGGADILAMDVLPFYKYADSRQLENLEAYMHTDPEFNKADYRANILNAVKYKNGTWFVPMDYSFNYYAYDSALLTGGAASGFGTGGKFTAEELIALAKPFFDGSSMIFNRLDYASGPRPDMWSLMMEENYTSFVDIENKTANFDNGSFENLLESVKRYGEEGLIRSAGKDATERFFFKPQNFVNLISLFTRDLGMRMTGMAEGGTMAVGDDDEIAGIEASSDGSVSFTYSQAYGINSNSKNKATAWAFIKFLLSEEMQLNMNLRPTVLPISNSAREKRMETMLTSMMEQQGQSLNEAHLEAIAKYNEAVNQLSGQIGAYVIKDIVINDMIAAEVAYFFDGFKSAAEVANTLQNKVTLYLNE